MTVLYVAAETVPNIRITQYFSVTFPGYFEFN